jgi:hypothetical protein
VPDETRRPVDYARRHLRFGWWSLLVFATLGLTLEALHGFKVRAYLDTSNETRRLMWTLAHAHGTLLAVVHVLFGLSVATFPEFRARSLRAVSAALLAASVLLPGGFFLGGIVFYAGDPGPGVLLVPIGAALLLVAIFYIAARLHAGSESSEQSPRRAAGARPDKPR